MDQRTIRLQVLDDDLNYLSSVDTKKNILLVRRNLEREERDLFALGLSLKKKVTRSNTHPIDQVEVDKAILSFSVFVLLGKYSRW